MLLALGALLALLLGASPATADGTGGSGGDRPVLRVGTEGTYEPFSFEDADGDLTGYDVDVMRAVADEAGYDVEFVQGAFDSLFPALDADRIDVIANQITINPEREARYLFTQPYTYSRGVIVTRTDTDDITSLADVAGVRAAQSETSNWAQVARDAGADVQSVDGLPQALELLAQGRVDVVINDNIAVLSYLSTRDDAPVEIAGDVDDEVSEQALVLRQDEQEVRDRLDQAQQRLAADGTLAGISEDYFGADVSVENTGEGVDPEGTARTRWEVVRDTAGPMALGALRVTLPLTVISFAAGLALALLAALARMSSSRWLRWPARTYISIIRGTPLLVQLFIVYYGLPELGLRLPGFTAACVALSLNVGGYAAEVIRSSILSVPRGQFEAATTLGMGYRQTMRRIVLPQASRIAVPPLSNTLLSLIKDTSLASVVLVTELFREAQTVAQNTGEFLVLYTLAAAYYWIICLVVSAGQGRLEKRLARYST
ncbi:ABC transporter substrate-binding protein/permease [Nocardioides litoris]|uniref:ABC transporter substrate-binding protein/permease n=1 Tax=Nocardioides litoris TaxID=1926648 RepID=UPI001FEBC1BE|nr:ABC transporter substrate-binding protein/permease [Nocardioides litoris]